MILGKLFKSIFGGGRAVTRTSEELTEPFEYKEFTIQAAPLITGSRFRTAGYISGDFEGEVRRVHFIRADQHAELQAAVEHSQSKARQIIDEMGPKLLERKQL